MNSFIDNIPFYSSHAETTMIGFLNHFLSYFFDSLVKHMDSFPENAFKEQNKIHTILV